MDKKYRLLDRDNNGFYRIVALCDIPRHNVKVGFKGGRVSGEHNLSQEGDCWIEYNVCVCDDARVCDDAVIWGGTHTPTKVGGNTVINGTTCLDSGTWMVTPKVISASKYDVVYNDEQIAIGCKCHPLEWWKEHGLKLAVRDEFTPEQIEEYRGHLDAIKKECADDKEV